MERVAPPPNWQVTNMVAQTGKRAVVTGTGGLGLEIARGLASGGAHVLLAGRDPMKGSAAIENIRRSVPGAQVEFNRLDLADLANIRAFARRMQERGTPIDVLVNNAGVMMPPRRRTTGDGFELQFGVNHLGHFLLTQSLLHLLRSAERPRVVTMSSGAHKTGQIDFEDLQANNSYKPARAYAQSKLANILFARELQRRSDSYGWNLLSIAAHPGYSRTALLQNGPGKLGPLGIWSALLNWLGQDAPEGALPALYAATALEAAPGAYYGPKSEIKGPPAFAKISPRGLDVDSAARLWDISETLVGSVPQAIP